MKIQGSTVLLTGALTAPGIDAARQEMEVNYFGPLQGTRVMVVMPVQTDMMMGTARPDPKVKPREVAAEALDAPASGLDEVFPGAPSKRAANAFKADPAAVQAQLSAMVHPVA